jgi:hypothetical protein
MINLTGQKVGMEQIQNGHPKIKDNYDPLTKKYGSNVNGVSYECGSNVFTANGLSVSGNSTSFFKDKYVIITYTNTKLRDSLIYCESNSAKCNYSSS